MIGPKEILINQETICQLYVGMYNSRYLLYSWLDGESRKSIKHTSRHFCGIHWGRRHTLNVDGTIVRTVGLNRTKKETGERQRKCELRQSVTLSLLWRTEPAASKSYNKLFLLYAVPVQYWALCKINGTGIRRKVLCSGLPSQSSSPPNHPFGLTT